MAEETWAKYKTYLQTLGYSPSTKSQYSLYARSYLEYSRGAYSKSTVLAFLALYTKHSGTTRRFITYIVKSLFRFLEKPWPLDKREMPKLSRPKRPVLSQAQVRQLVEIASVNPLDHALVTLDAILGARREELARIQLADYLPPHIRIRTAKGGDERVRYIGDKACAVIDWYLVTRSSPSSFLFVSKYGTPLTPTAMSVLFRKMAVQAGIPKGIGWHAIRRSVVTWLFEGGMREREIQEVFGWKSLAMPAQYIQLSQIQVNEQVKKIHPMLRE